MKVEKVARGRRIFLSYSIWDRNGKEVERVAEDHPFSFIQGQGEVPIGIEEAVEGMSIGEKKTVSLNSSNGFGRVANEKFEVPINAFGEVPKVGQWYEILFENEWVDFRVLEVNHRSVLATHEHPLAGLDLQIDLKVLAVEGLEMNRAV